MYGIILFAALVSCLLLIERKLTTTTDKQFLWKSAFFMICGGIVGARLYHVVHLWNYYAHNPQLSLQIWHGGFGFYGALLGALVAFLVVGAIELHNKPSFSFFFWLDRFAFYLPLAQFIGRFGNVVNNELLPYAYIESVYALLVFVSFGLIHKYAQNRLYKGFFSGLYLVCYGTFRLVFEPLHSGGWVIGPIYTAQILSILAIITGTGVLVYGKKRSSNSH